MYSRANTRVHPHSRVLLFNKAATENVVSRPELNRLVVKDDYQWKGSQLIPAPVDKDKEVERRVKGISENVKQNFQQQVQWCRS